MASTYVSDVPQAECLRDEPTLDELFAEPIIQMVMRRDGVKAQQMRLELDMAITEQCLA